jgi:hypothetical protein
MLKLRLGSSKPTVLCLGAHCDDIEIGCGGTLLPAAHRASPSIGDPERAARSRAGSAGERAIHLGDGTAFFVDATVPPTASFPSTGSTLSSTSKSWRSASSRISSSRTIAAICIRITASSGS